MSDNEEEDDPGWLTTMKRMCQDGRVMRTGNGNEEEEIPGRLTMRRRMFQGG